MLTLYTSDLHGHAPHYRELARLCRQHRPEVLILGGDLLPKGSGSLDQRVPRQASYLFGQILPLLAGLKEECGVLSLVMLGNDDFAAHQPRLEGECVRLGLLALHGRSVTIGHTVFAGCSCVGFTPFRLKDWELPDREDEPPRPGCSDDTRDGTWRTVPPMAEGSVAECLEGLLLERAREHVLVSHAPPYGTSLDRLWDGEPVGSVAVLEFLSERQPTVSLHGHIHESPCVSGRWAEAVGRTLAIQPGQTPEVLHAVLLDTSDPFGTAWHTVYGPLPPTQRMTPLGKGAQ